MSIVLSRRDALKGAMAAGAAIAASPYFLNLAGGSSAIPAQNVPVQPAAVSSPAASASPSAGTEGEATVLVVRGDIITRYSGTQTIKVQDAALAARLKSSLQARFE